MCKVYLHIHIYLYICIFTHMYIPEECGIEDVSSVRTGKHNDTCVLLWFKHPWWKITNRNSYTFRWRPSRSWPFVGIYVCRHENIGFKDICVKDALQYVGVWIAAYTIVHQCGEQHNTCEHMCVWACVCVRASVCMCHLTHFCTCHTTHFLCMSHFQKKFVSQDSFLHLSHNNFFLANVTFPDFGMCLITRCTCDMTHFFHISHDLRCRVSVECTCKGIEAVHFDQQLIQRVFTLVVASSCRTQTRKHAYREWETLTHAHEHGK